MTTTWNCKAGDYHRRLTLDLTDITTAGASGVTFKVKNRDTGAVVVNDVAGTIESASRVSFQFTGTQLDVAGYYLAEARLIFGDGQETVPTSGQVVLAIEARI